MVFGVCTAIAAGYFAITDHRENPQEFSLKGNGGSTAQTEIDRIAIPTEIAKPTEEVKADSQEKPRETIIVQNHSESSAEESGWASLQNTMEDTAPADADLTPAVPSSVTPIADAPPVRPQDIETGPEAGELAVTSPEERLAMVYSSDPYGLLPPWLKETVFEMPRKSPVNVAQESASAAQSQEIATLKPGPVAKEPSVTPDYQARNDRLKTAESLRPESPEILTTASGGEVSPGYTSKNTKAAMVGAPEIPELVFQPPKIASPVTRPTPKIALTNENAPAVQIPGNALKGNELKVPGNIASFVAVQGDDFLKNTSPQERGEPQGYITLESKPEAVRNVTPRSRAPKPSEQKVKPEEDTAEPPDNPPKSQDPPLRRRDDPGKTAGESNDLRHFASDFVRTDQSGSIEDQHRFYADSVEFYGEGDLSWAGVAAATRRYHQEKQNMRYGAAAPAVVRGPVDGGFYLVEQPVSWTRQDGSRLTRGRSILRLRVLATGRGGWKITSIEEVTN